MEMKRLLESIDAPMRRMNDTLKNVQDNLEGKSIACNKVFISWILVSKRVEILRWLSPEPYIQHHEQTKKDVLLGSGAWLLSDPVFDTWKNESVSSILWLHGIPGSGKSKLV
jgi:hypothetical protein